MQYRGLFCVGVYNLGDFFNGMPVVSGLAKAIGEPLRFVVPGTFRQFNGFREFLEYQPCIKELVYQDEIINFDHSSYIITTYSHEEFKSLTERPNRPIETMRWEKTVRDYYPHIEWEVDDDFEFSLSYQDYNAEWYIIGDRWSNIVDKRRDWNILQKSGLFDDINRFCFLDYNRSLMENAVMIKSSIKPFISTFTGSGMLADLLKKETWCVYDNSMTPLWNDKPIEYSYWKHFYGDRNNKLIHIDDPILKGL